VTYEPRASLRISDSAKTAAFIAARTFRELQETTKVVTKAYFKPGGALQPDKSSTCYCCSRARVSPQRPGVEFSHINTYAIQGMSMQ